MAGGGLTDDMREPTTLLLQYHDGKLLAELAHDGEIKSLNCDFCHLHIATILAHACHSFVLYSW